ncbi:MAG: response regulator, partial [Candidatus Thermoplasmatota archaeon]|nr:response regulator [Candidatus Thermoplasmatota archaeon]
MDILMVDDERVLLEQAKVFLEKRNDEFDIEPATSAEKALKKLEEEDYDLVVSDYQMPETDGLEFLKELREKRENDIPFIMFTGKGREEVAMEALNLGADRYLQKGGDPKTQYGVLADAIDQEAGHHSTEELLKLAKYSIERANREIFWITEEGKFTYANETA